MKSIVKVNVDRDVCLRDFFKSNERFEAIVNAVLFHGKKIVIPEHIHELDSNQAILTDKSIDYNDQDNKKRDVVRKVWINNGYVIIAIENQHESKRNMVARCGNYDMLRYLDQLENKSEVYGVITIVLFTGEHRWKNPKTIMYAIGVIHQEVKEFIHEYKAYIEDVKDINPEEISDEESRVLMEGIQGVYAMKKDTSKQLDYLSMSQEVALYVAVVTEFEELLDKVKEAKEGEMIHMCDALDNLREAYKQEGIAQEQKKSVQTMISKGFDITVIAECLSLTKEQIEAYIEPIPAV